MASVNKVILIGNLGTDPEMRSFENGSKVARVRIATTESYTNKEGQRVEQTEWHTVTMWRQLADVAERYLTKGKQVYIEGKLRTRSWKDADGNDRYTTEIEANTMQMLGSKQGAEGDAPQRPAASNHSAPAQEHSASVVPGPGATDSDDLPF